MNMSPVCTVNQITIYRGAKKKFKNKKKMVKNKKKFNFFYL